MPTFESPVRFVFINIIVVPIDKCLSFRTKPAILAVLNHILERNLRFQHRCIGSKNIFEVDVDDGICEEGLTFSSIQKINEEDIEGNSCYLSIVEFRRIGADWIESIEQLFRWITMEATIWWNAVQTSNVAKLKNWITEHSVFEGLNLRNQLCPLIFGSFPFLTLYVDIANNMLSRNAESATIFERNFCLKA